MKPSRSLLYFATPLILLITAIALWYAATSGTQAKRTVTVGLYQNAPKVYIAQNGRPAGLFVELIEAIAREEKWHLRYARCEWEECLKQLEQGQIDLMPDVAFSAARAQRFDFHRVSIANSWSQIYAHPDASVQTLADLAGKRIAILQGGIQQSFLAQLMRESGLPYQPGGFPRSGLSGRT